MRRKRDIESATATLPTSVATTNDSSAMRRCGTSSASARQLDGLSSTVRATQYRVFDAGRCARLPRREWRDSAPGAERRERRIADAAAQRDRITRDSPRAVELPVQYERELVL